MAPIDPLRISIPDFGGDVAHVGDATRRREASYNVARLLLIAPIDPWRNSIPVFGALAFCTTNIKDFRTPLTSTSVTAQIAFRRLLSTRFSLPHSARKVHEPYISHEIAEHWKSLQK